MSIEATKWVNEQAPPTGNDRDHVVLSILAYHAHKDGRNTFPSRETIAWEAWRNTSPVKLRTVSKALKSLIESGHISKDEGCSFPGYLNIPTYRRPTAYKLNLSLMSEKRPVSRDIPVSRDTTVPKGSSVFDGQSGMSLGVKSPVLGDNQTVSKQEDKQGAETLPNSAFIPEEWLGLNDGLQRCLSRHPNGNQRCEPCFGCRDTAAQLKELRRQLDLDTEARARTVAVARSIGKEECDICNHQGRRLTLNHRTGLTRDIDCLHREIDREDAIAALLSEGKDSEAAKLTTAIRAVA